MQTADGGARRVRLGLPAADGDGLPGAVDNRVARALPLAVRRARRAAVPRDRGGAEAGRRLGRGDARLVRVGLGLGLGFRFGLGLLPACNSVDHRVSHCREGDIACQ